MARKFVRFVIARREGVTGRRVGFFRAAYRLRRESGALPEDQGRLAELLDWLDDAIAVPSRFARSQNPRAHGKGLSWFKPEATEHIAKARELMAILERAGIVSGMLTTAAPGYVLYEDDVQVCAEPFRESET